MTFYICYYIILLVTCIITYERELRKISMKRRNYRVLHDKTQIEVMCGNKSIIIAKDEKASELIRFWIEKVPSFTEVSNLILTNQDLTIIETIG